MAFLKKVGSNYKVLEKQIERLGLVLGEPMNIGPTEFRFDEPEFNKKQYLKYSKRQKDLIHEFSTGIGLYRLNDYIVFDDSAKSILYFVHFKTRNILGHKLVVQRILWGSPRLVKEKFQVKGQSVSAYVLFEKLLKEAEGIGIVTDSKQTISGKRFWERRIAQAFERGLYVFIIDQVTKKKMEVYDDNEFEKVAKEHEIWTDKQAGMARRVVISEKKLW